MGKPSRNRGKLQGGGEVRLGRAPRHGTLGGRCRPNGTRKAGCSADETPGGRSEPWGTLWGGRGRVGGAPGRAETGTSCPLNPSEKKDPGGPKTGTNSFLEPLRKTGRRQFVPNPYRGFGKPGQGPPPLNPGKGLQTGSKLMVPDPQLRASASPLRGLGGGP
ncbi:hypothetical protein CRENBAI_004403 [Crenichthys baileyi]|uniref:Uncharacterized protein n=1 Tax=Crenichthys baileyi TaxID=28760 RepID=A0AAV9RGI8_9TELE